MTGLLVHHDTLHHPGCPRLEGVTAETATPSDVEHADQCRRCSDGTTQTVDRVGDVRNDEHLYTDGGTEIEAAGSDSEELWAGSPSDLEDKLNDHYGVEGICIRGDYYHEAREEYLYDCLVYFDGDEEHFIADDVPILGHAPSGAAGVALEDLPGELTVQRFVAAVDGGASA